MMTKTEKKEAFIQIIENWFEDFSGDINPDNCVSFYNHFILCLKFESKVSVNYSRNFFFKSALDILCYFDKMLENDKMSKKLVVEMYALKNIYDQLTGSKEPFITLVDDFKKIYNTTKDEYFL